MNAFIQVHYYLSYCICWCLMNIYVSQCLTLNLCHSLNHSISLTLSFSFCLAHCLSRFISLPLPLSQCLSHSDYVFASFCHFFYFSLFVPLSQSSPYITLSHPQLLLLSISVPFSVYLFLSPCVFPSAFPSFGLSFSVSLLPFDSSVCIIQS